MTFPFPVFVPAALRAGTVTTGTTPNTTSDFATGFTHFDRNLAVTNGATIYSIGFYSTSARTITVKAALQNSTTAFDIVVSQSFSHPGGGWADCVLTTPYIVPASGTYNIGAYTTGLNDYNNTGSRSFKAGDITGVQTGLSADTNGNPGFRWTAGVY